MGDVVCGHVQVLKNRPDMKMVVMSATLDAEKFQKYFDNAPLLVRSTVSVLHDSVGGVARQAVRCEMHQLLSHKSELELISQADCSSQCSQVHCGVSVSI